MLDRWDDGDRAYDRWAETGESNDSEVIDWDFDPQEMEVEEKEISWMQ